MNKPTGRPGIRKGLDDDALLDLVQRQTFRYFWDNGYPVSGLARDRTRIPDRIAVGGSGFGAMAIVVAAERGWITRAQAVSRLRSMVDHLGRATRYHGAFPHFLDGRTDATIAFMSKDDGGDIVETSLLFQGLLTVREYFSRQNPDETALRAAIETLWREVEWSWYTRDGGKVLTLALEPRLRLGGEPGDPRLERMPDHLRARDSLAHPSHRPGGLPSRAGPPAASSATGNATTVSSCRSGRPMVGRSSSHNTPFSGSTRAASRTATPTTGSRTLPTPASTTNTAFTTRPAAAAMRPNCWGLTASTGERGYAAFAPGSDLCTIAPTAALASLPYAPDLVMPALRHFYEDLGDRLWRDYGFIDAFSLATGWYSSEHLAVNQGPIIVMFENFRSGLLWDLFMGCREVQTALRMLGFESPRLPGPTV